MGGKENLEKKVKNLVAFISFYNLYLFFYQSSTVVFFTSIVLATYCLFTFKILNFFNFMLVALFSIKYASNINHDLDFGEYFKIFDTVGNNISNIRFLNYKKIKKKHYKVNALINNNPVIFNIFINKNFRYENIFKIKENEYIAVLKNLTPDLNLIKINELEQ